MSIEAGEFDLGEDAAAAAARTQSRIEAMRIGMLTRSQAYRDVFQFDTLSGFTVMQDLAWVCRANRSLWTPDVQDMTRRVAMREVWLRIQHHVALTPTQLVALYSDVFVKEGFGK